MLNNRETILKLLEQYGVHFKQQYVISTLQTKQNLKFDFAIFYNNKLSHMIECCLSPDDNDKQKEKYCEQNNIPLIKIKNEQVYGIEDLLLYHTKMIKNEVFQDYKKTSLLISNSFCDFKCDKENNCQLCQNMPLSKSKTLYPSFKYIIEQYVNNPLTNAIVFGGLEPFDEFDQLKLIIEIIREYYKINDDIIIYTGYYSDEIIKEIKILKKYSNIIIKFGRFKPNDKPHFDNILGINLANKEQYAEKIS